MLRHSELSSFKPLEHSRSTVILNSSAPNPNQNSCSKLYLFKFRALSSVWYFSSSKSLQNIEKLQERALRFQYNNHASPYNDLLSKSDRCTMFISRQRAFCIEIFKNVKNKTLHLCRTFSNYGPHAILYEI